MLKFKVGKKYFSRSICDHNCIFEYAIIKRTDKTVTISNDDGIFSKQIKIINDEETVKPLGSYSMAPILRAGRISE